MKYLVILAFLVCSTLATTVYFDDWVQQHNSRYRGPFPNGTYQINYDISSDPELIRICVSYKSGFYNNTCLKNLSQTNVTVGKFISTKWYNFTEEFYVIVDNLGHGMTQVKGSFTYSNNTKPNDSSSSSKVLTDDIIILASIVGVVVIIVSASVIFLYCKQRKKYNSYEVY